MMLYRFVKGKDSLLCFLGYHNFNINSDPLCRSTNHEKIGFLFSIFKSQNSHSSLDLISVNKEQVLLKKTEDLCFI